MNNQLIKQDAEKIRVSLCTKELVYAMAIVREYGLNKYPTDSWKEVEPYRYVDALYRHLLELIDKGIWSRDSESGLMHLQHIACNVGFLLSLKPKESESKRPILSEQEEDEELVRKIDLMERINSHNKTTSERPVDDPFLEK